MLNDVHEGRPRSCRSLSYHYPIGNENVCMNDDQWIPFALCMRQSRARKGSLVSKEDIFPLRMIINGEGGTGKTWLINHIVEDMRVVFSDSSKRILLMAHHGTAAYNINGRTICSSLGIGFASTGFNKQYVPLSASKTG